MVKELYAKRDSEEYKEKKVKALCASVLKPYTGQVEVSDGKKLITLYFPRHPYKDFLDETEISEFEAKVDRASHKTRAEGIMRTAPAVLNSIQAEYTIYKSIQSFWVINYLYNYVNVSKAICILLVSTLLGIIDCVLERGDFDLRPPRYERG